MAVSGRVGAGLVVAISASLLFLAVIGSPTTVQADELFVDDFESGTTSLWTTVSGVTAQQGDVFTGAWAARAASTGSPAYARKRLGAAAPDATFGSAVNITSQGSKPVTLMTLQTLQGGALVSLYVTAGGKLASRNFITATSTVSTVDVPRGTWHQLSLRANVAGASSEVEVSLDGALAPTLSGTTSLGTTGVGQVQIGDAAKRKRFVVDYDDVAVSLTTPDVTPPAAPSDLTAKAVSSGQVDLAWLPATDDVAVVEYQVFRDGISVATVNAATVFSDITVQPATTYVYEVRAKDAAGNVSPASNPASVTTLEVVLTPDPVIAAAGDIACSPTEANYNGGLGTATACHQLATSDLLLGGQVSRVLPLGDLQYESGTLTAFLTSYEPTWGRVKAITSPVPGNHEYGTAGAAGYFDYFGAAVGDRATGYYSYDIGTWHLIALNSNCAKLPAGTGVNGCAEGSPQNDWLEQDLAAHSNTCTLAYWHHARFSSGLHGNFNPAGAFWSDLYAAGADVVLSGHDHDYERFTPMSPSGGTDPSRGIRQFVVGTGGDDFYAFTTVQPATSEVRQDHTFGVLKLTLHPASYDWTFVPEAGQTFSDSGSEPCH